MKIMHVLLLVLLYYYYILQNEDFHNCFHSMSEVVGESGMGDYVHIVYLFIIQIGSFSKDFGISGFRVGYIYSRNKKLMEVLENIGSFQNISNYNQVLLANVL